ncbi:protein PHYTOCHROME KINASE SUBSTRATE 1-like [Cynara cardunculus var. scolymus]|uniref:protein PHYTOCHROME KINASE SUBSTRATE 1-like n=1 Tax=Cynara cardunculus var. scolymus TaxID=59895 RepID=UPI000D62461D|nr:protein PHYTOCHROME KINASE SUBSTRATE 1-like [Cynara cardunculus var. scolymus]
MITTDKRTHNTTLMDAYLNNPQHHFTIKLPQSPQKRNLQDDEIGIFGAEKYFTGAIDDHLLLTTTSNNNHPAAHYPSSNTPQLPPCPSPKPKTHSTTPSVRSESSWNSRKGLLATNANDHKKKNTVKSLLASLVCNCNDKDSVDVTETKVYVKEPAKLPVQAVADLGQKTKSLSSRWADEDVHRKKNEMNSKREDCFTFPVLNSSMPDGNHPQLRPQVEREKRITARENSSEVFGSPVLEKGKKSFSLERKLTMLNWDGVTPRAEVMDISRNGGHNDAASDASSDLFEIESFSTNENNSFLAKQALESNDGRPSNANGYAPSEASVDWSVVTASVADFSTVEDSTVIQRVKAGAETERVKGSGILSGCKNLKAVRVSGDEHCVAGGGEKAAVMVAPTMREWCRRLESVTPITKIQADTKLAGAGSDAHRGQTGFGTARSIPRMHSTHASHHLYIQQ